MKKTILFLSVIMLLSVSCSKSKIDPDPVGPPAPPPPPPAEEQKALPTKVVMETEGGTETYVISYISNSQKIEKITITGTDFNSEERYTYKGDLIDKIEYNNGEDYTQFQYENNALVREISYRDHQEMDKTEYEYPANQSVKQRQYVYEDGDSQLDGDVLFELDANGNLVKGEADFGDDGSIEITATYDDKNTPVVNISGWSQIRLTGGIPLGDNIDFADIAGRRNNPSKVVANVSGELMSITYTYEFKDEKNPNFPTKIIGKLGDETLFSAVISYN